MNLWDVRSQAIRQHYGQAHGSPISQIAFHPVDDLLLSASSDRSLRLWDLRAGRLRYTIRGHERPVLACDWDDEGATFTSCDCELVQLWKLPAQPPARRDPPGAAQWSSAPSDAAVARNPPGAVQCISAPSDAAARQQAMSCDLGLPPDVLQAAWGNATGVCAAPKGARTAGYQTGVEETVARTLEHMVSQMDLLTQSLQGMESRVQRNEEALMELVTEARARRSQA